MYLDDIVSNTLHRDDSGVWLLEGRNSFPYTDGAASERHLRRAFTTAKDLSTTSEELEAFIKDWPSEYHLTRKRAQLLEGLSMDRSMRVLEVGCGCGAITRHLAENFDHVVSVEGSIERAKLARLRTRDLDTVSIICGPFQEIEFVQKFDAIFCIGVFEYSAAFIAGEDPYRAALDYFSKMLTDDGILIIAIENQFGLKYFNGAREDHLGTLFDGIEGYSRHPGKARTFGRVELDLLVKEKFEHTRFLYPYPDYKIPDCVLSDEFLKSGRAAEIISQIPSRDYSRPMRSFWNEAFASLEIGKNAALEFFANSFLVLASRRPLNPALFPQMGTLYSDGRKKTYTTRTRILKRDDGSVVTDKRKISTSEQSDPRLSLVDTVTPWIEGRSLFTIVHERAAASKREESAIFEPCKAWLAYLTALSTLKNGVRMLDGSHVDSIWRNAYLVDSQCVLIDREWVWSTDIPLNVVVIRAIYDFLSRLETSDLAGLRQLPSNGRAAIARIAATIGVTLGATDFNEFVKIECQLTSIVSGRSSGTIAGQIRWFLADRSSRRVVRRYRPYVVSIAGRVAARLRNRFGYR